MPILRKFNRLQFPNLEDFEECCQMENYPVFTIDHFANQEETLEELINNNTLKPIFNLKK